MRSYIPSREKKGGHIKAQFLAQNCAFDRQLQLRPSVGLDRDLQPTTSQFSNCMIELRPVKVIHDGDMSPMTGSFSSALDSIQGVYSQ